MAPSVPGVVVCLVVALCAVVGVGVFYRGHPWSFGDPTVVSTEYVLNDEVRQRTVATSRVPARFASILSANRLKFRRFTGPSEVLGDVLLTTAQANAHGAFAKYDSKAYLVNATYLPALGESVIEELTTRQFIDKMTDRNDDAFYFYHEPLRTDFGGDVLAAFPPGVVIDKDGAKSFLTLAKTGAQFQAHYHEEPVFIAQMSGRAQIRLVAPAHLSSLHPYPLFHPNHGFIQAWLGPLIHLESLTSPLGLWGSIVRIIEHALYFNDVRTLPTYTTTLIPGDILYIPPFWTYHTTFLNNTIQIGITTISYEQSAQEQLRMLGFAVTNVEHLTIFALRKMVVDIVSGVFDYKGDEAKVEAFLSKHLVQGRLAPIYLRFLSIGSSTNFSACETHRTGSDKELASQVASFSGNQLKQVLEIFESIATDIPDQGAARDIILTDYIEYYIHKAIGADDAWAFLANCFGNLGIGNVKAVAGPVALTEPPVFDDKLYYGLNEEMKKTFNKRRTDL